VGARRSIWIGPWTYETYFVRSWLPNIWCHPWLTFGKKLKGLVWSFRRWGTFITYNYPCHLVSNGGHLSPCQWVAETQVGTVTLSSSSIMAYNHCNLISTSISGHICRQRKLQLALSQWLVPIHHMEKEIHWATDVRLQVWFLSCFVKSLAHVFAGLDFMFPKSSSCQASVTGITVHNLMHWKFHHHANVIFLEHSSSWLFQLWPWELVVERKKIDLKVLH